MAAIGQVDGARVRATAQPPRVGLVALAAAGVLAAAAAAVLLVVSGQRPAASPTAQDAPAAAGLPAGAGAAGASGAAGAAGAADAATASAPAAGSDRMALRLGGLLLPLENGMRVPAGGDLAAELFFAPYPPAGRTNLDVYVVNERTGQAVADAQVTLRYEMPDMEHGVVMQPAASHSNGHYVLPLNVFMVGNWQLAIQLSRPGQRGEITLAMTVLPPGR